MAHEELDRIGVARAVQEARERMATREPSNCRFLISERALEAIRPIPQSVCEPAADLTADAALQFPGDRAAASAEAAAENDDLYRRAVTEAMQLSGRAQNCLARGGIVTLGDLARHTVRDLQSIRALGAKTLDEILAEVRRLGITLPITAPGGLVTWLRR